MLKANKLTLSASSLENVAKCTTKAWLSKICGLTTREESAPLKIGSAAHFGAAVWFKEQDREKAYQAFAGEYQEWAEMNVLDDDIRGWPNSHEVYWAWLCGLDEGSLPFTWEAEQVEQHLQASWGVVNGVDVTLEGYVDLPVRERITGDRWVLDHKFTGWLKRDTIEAWKLSAQFRCYAWLWEQVTGEQVSGLYVNAIEWSRLPKISYNKPKKDGTQTERKCRTHGVPYSECRFYHANKELVPMTLMPGDLTLWQENTQELIGRLTGWIQEFEHLDPRDVIDRIPMEGTFSGACSWCEFKRFCVSGRQRHLLDTMMVERPGREAR